MKVSHSIVAVTFIISCMQLLHAAEKEPERSDSPTYQAVLRELAKKREREQKEHRKK